MDRGLFLASGAASNLMERQAVVAHNMANASTAGFKKVFDRVASVSPPVSAAALPDARAYAVTLTPGIDSRPGPLVATGNSMDLALGQGMYLAVGAGEGEAYTRRGGLLLDALGVLRLATGQTVLGQDGGPVAIPAGFTGSVGEDGTIWAQDPANRSNRQEVGRLRIQKASGIELRLDGFYELKDPQPAPEGARALTPGYIEQSNVSAADMLSTLIETSRLYDLNTKLITAFATMDQKGSEILANWQ